LQHRDIVGTDEDDLIHDVCYYPLGRYKFDGVSGTDVFERPKESIAVAGNSDVPAFAGAIRTDDVAHATVKCQVIGAVKHRYLKMNFGNAQHGQWWIEIFRQALFIRSDPLFRPEADIQFGPGTWEKTNGRIDGLLRLNISEAF